MLDWLTGIVGEDAAPLATYSIILLILIVGFFVLKAMWRRMRGGTYVNGGHGRKQRLAVIDAAPVDNRRRLVLVRRDDVEHLVLIGGMNDLVIEQDIEVQKAGKSESAIASLIAEADAEAKPVQSNQTNTASAREPKPRPITAAEKPDSRHEAVAPKTAPAAAPAAPINRTPAPAPITTSAQGKPPQSIADEPTPALTPMPAPAHVAAPAPVAAPVSRPSPERTSIAAEKVSTSQNQNAAAAAIVTGAVAAPAVQAAEETQTPVQQEKAGVQEIPRVEPEVAKPTTTPFSETLNKVEQERIEPAPVRQEPVVDASVYEGPDEFVPISAPEPTISAPADISKPVPPVSPQPESDEADLEDEMEQLLNKLTSASRS